MERSTIEVYEHHAGTYAAARPPRHRRRASALAAAALPGLPLADVGCGPGGYLASLGRRRGRAPGAHDASGAPGAGGPLGEAGAVVGLDAAAAMLAIARAAEPGVPFVRADVEALPFRRMALGGAWARNSYLHLPAGRLPLALARLHHAMAVGAPLRMSMLAGHGEEGGLADDDIPGRFFTLWPPGRLRDVVEGAGFADVGVSVGRPADHRRPPVWVDGTRARTLPDFVATGLRVLVCGLNPSLVAADAGYGYAGPTNRFWRASAASGLVTRLRDPWHALDSDGVGMTCLVKRATPRSSLLSRDEYRAGAARVRRLVEWLAPRLVLFVGLEGWRAAVAPRAQPGLQEGRFGGALAYVMPSTSGLNAHASFDQLVAHMRAALAAAVTEPAHGSRGAR